MDRRAFSLAFIFASCFGLYGCVAEPQAVLLDLRGAVPSADVSDLSFVLNEAVTEDGRFKPAAVARLMDRLDSQLRRMAVTGPSLTPELYPTRSSRLAYLYNARMGWTLKLASLAGFPERVVSSRMYRRPFPLDGRKRSIQEIDQLLLREASRTGDFRIAACAPGTCLCDAPLPRRPYRAEGFDRDLCEAINALVTDEDRVILDIEKKRVRLPRMLWACRDLVVARYQQKYGVRGADLISAVSAYLRPAARRRLEHGLGYEVGPHSRECKAAVAPRKIFFPGRVGRIGT